MSTVENLAAQATDVLLLLPIAELTSVAGDMERARQLAATTTAESESPDARAMNEHLADAQAGLTAGVCALGTADVALRGYLTNLGAALPEQSNSGAHHTNPEPAPGPDRYETALAEIEDAIHVDVDDEFAASPGYYEMRGIADRYGPVLRKALATRHRDRALQLLERLVSYVDPFNPGYATNSRKAVRAVGGELAGGACAPELVALTGQTADPELAARASRLLFASFTQEITAPDPAAVAHATETFEGNLAALLEEVEEMRESDWNAVRDYDYSRAGEISQRRYNDACEQVKAIAEQLLYHLGDSAKGDFLQTIMRLEADVDTKYLGRDIMKHVFASDRGRKSFIAATGLLASDIEHAWDTGYKRLNEKDPTEEEVRANNLWLMYDLERSRPGTCAALNGSLNLHNFERLSPASLRIARAALDKPPKSYILFASVTRSKNPAMRMRHGDIDAMNAMAKKHGTVIIPIEFASEADLRRIRRGLSEAGWGQADHLIVNAHSDDERLGVGVDGNGTDIYITSDDLLQPGYRSIGRVVETVVKEGGTVCMLSCRSGENGVGSLAYNVAYTSRRTTFAADQTVKSSVSLKKDPATGKLIPVPSYIGTNYQSVDPVRFDP